MQELVPGSHLRFRTQFEDDVLDSVEGMPPVPGAHGFDGMDALYVDAHGLKDGTIHKEGAAAAKGWRDENHRAGAFGMDFLGDLPRNIQSDRLDVIHLNLDGVRQPCMGGQYPRNFCGHGI